jgi:hypothetical protein
MNEVPQFKLKSNKIVERKLILTAVTKILEEERDVTKHFIVAARIRGCDLNVVRPLIRVLVKVNLLSKTPKDQGSKSHSGANNPFESDGWQ